MNFTIFFLSAIVIANVRSRLFDALSFGNKVADIVVDRDRLNSGFQRDPVPDAVSLCQDERLAAFPTIERTTIVAYFSRGNNMTCSCSSPSLRATMAIAGSV